MCYAAGKGHLAVCQFLVAEQCPCDEHAIEWAAQGGYTEVVRFLHESGCPWDVDTICVEAAESIEPLQYLKQQGCVFTEAVMSNAASSGNTHICQFLRVEQCPWDTEGCKWAARNGHVDTLRWLHEQGCPWDVEVVRLTAADGGHVPVLDFMQNFEPAATAAKLTEMLNAAGSRDYLAAAKWLRQQGAEWPAVLKGNCWLQATGLQLCNIKSTTAHSWCHCCAASSCRVNETAQHNSRTVPHDNSVLLGDINSCVQCFHTIPTEKSIGASVTNCKE
jgi:hypothetical protein